MIAIQTRTSWDTNVKIYVRNGLHKNLPKEILQSIPKSNINRWQNEPKDKYRNCGLQNLIEKDVTLLQLQNEFPSSKKITWAYIKLLQGSHQVLDTIKEYPKLVRQNKETIVNTIEAVKQVIPVEQAVKIFKISRATYQNYKTLIISKCHNSYFEWCVKRYAQQLLNKEVLKIKKYLEDRRYEYWSKSSLYYVGLRNGDFNFSLATFYKYSQLLGYDKRHIKRKPKYQPLVSTKPNQTWCADVTIYKTADGVKHYILFLCNC